MAKAPTTNIDLSAIEEVRSAIARAQAVTVLTGAGISAESGIPTFRDVTEGLWSRFRPEEIANAEAFERDPAFVWAWYSWRRGIIGRAEPNAGHGALVLLQRKHSRCIVVTQNVDGLHERAGSPRPIELHGNIFRDRCHAEGRLLAPGDVVAGPPPRCRFCNGLARPDVVWFGEPLPPDALARACAAAASCGVFLCVGTSALVEPAASLPFIARDAGAMVVEVNPASTPLTPHASIVLQASASAVLPLLVP